jgi:hypothetical protein
VGRVAAPGAEMTQALYAHMSNKRKKILKKKEKKKESYRILKQG